MALQDRYTNSISLKTLPNGRVVYRSMLPKTIYKNILFDVEIPAEDMLRMDRLAFNVYGDASLWWKIAAVNARFHGSMFFRPGSLITISAE